MIPQLTDQEYEALKAAIRQAGRVLVPVVEADDGEVIDGLGRVRAATELGIKDYPREVVGGVDAEARRLLRVALNCTRRHLTPDQRRQVAGETLRASPDMNDAWVAEVTGLDGKTVRRVREELESTSEIPTLTEFRRRDGRVQPRHVYARTAREAKGAADALTVLGEEAPRRVMTAREASRAARRHAARAAKSEGLVAVAPVADADDCGVHHCDFRELPVAPGSARLVFTDPLYHRLHLPLYSALGEWAKRVLEPGGLLVTYLGTSFLPEVVRRLGEHLEYVWACPTMFALEKTSIHDRKVRTGWKPLLVYSNGPYRPRDWLPDVVTARREKRRHVFQQPEAEADHFVRLLTESGELVLDPFCGSGTTAKVCKRLGRRCLTSDIDPAAVADARTRVRQTQAGDPLVRPRFVLGPMPLEADDPISLASA